MPAEVPDGVLAAAPAAGEGGDGAPGPGRQGVGGALHPQHEGPAVPRLVRLRARELPRGRGLLRVRARRGGRVPRPHLQGGRAARAGGQAPDSLINSKMNEKLCALVLSNPEGIYCTPWQCSVRYPK